jgi:hypothetical protein
MPNCFLKVAIAKESRPKVLEIICDVADHHARDDQVISIVMIDGGHATLKTLVERIW